MYPDEPPLPFSEEYFNQRAEILCHEQILIRALSFDLSVHHPHPYLVQFVHSKS
jgi:hypothetical protein